MPRNKIPRKSTNIDMTAMCDVAFLLLSFFILATKTKPPEAIKVTTPSSVSSEVASDKAIVITMSPDGKVFLLFGDDSKKRTIFTDINKYKSLGLSDAEIAKWSATSYVGLPFNQIKGSLALSQPITAAQMGGIPVKDSMNNELTDWVASIVRVYQGEKLSLLVKGDNNAKYPVFSNILDALKKNDQNKFKLITSKEEIPAESELYKSRGK
ncbi:MAG: biopolymer transporter ExbD [Ferruginibacter sp.]